MQDHIPVFYSAVGDLLVKLENEIKANLGKILCKIVLYMGDHLPSSDCSSLSTALVIVVCWSSNSCSSCLFDTSKSSRSLMVSFSS